MSLLAPYLAACALLVAAGAAKAWRPADTARALAAGRVRLTGRRLVPAVRVAAAVEAALGLGAAADPRPATAAAVAASYTAFAAFVLWQRRRGGALSSCGCFATPDTPATALHAVVDAGLAAAAAAVAAGPGGALPTLLAAQPARGVPLVATAVVAAGLAYLVLTALPRLQAAAGRAGGRAR